MGQVKGEEKEEAIIFKFKWEKQKKKKKTNKQNKQKKRRKTIHFRDLFRTGEAAEDNDADESVGKDKTDEISAFKSKFVVCFESRFPNQFADVDSHILDQMQSCINKCPCVDCKASTFDLRRIE